MHVIDPTYFLKGAARIAQEHYLPPNYQPPVDPINIFQRYEGHLSDHEAGIQYLEAMKDLGTSLINMGRKTRDAAAVFLEMIDLDHNDRLVTDHVVDYY